MQLKLALVLTVFLLIFICIPTSRAGVGISPAFVEANLDVGRSAGQFTITNLGEDEERFRIQAIHFVFSRDGALRRIPPDERSLAGWIKFNPTEFSLPPKSNRAIRYVIIPKGTLQTGEYWGAMELESLQSQAATAKDQNGHEMKIEVVSSILVPIWGKVGRVRYQGAFKEASVIALEKGQGLRLLLQNTGDGRLRIENGEFAIKNSAGVEVEKGTMGKFYLLPGQEQQITTNPLLSNLPPGEYQVRVICHSFQLKTPLEGDLPMALK
jgi:hypothetical protein